MHRSILAAFVFSGLACGASPSVPDMALEPRVIGPPVASDPPRPSMPGVVAGPDLTQPPARRLALGRFDGLTLPPEGTYVAVRSESARQIQVYAPDGLVATLDSNVQYSPRAAAPETLYYVVGWTGPLKAWWPELGSSRTMTIATDAYPGITISPDGQRIVITARDPQSQGNLAVFYGPPPGSLERIPNARAAQFSPRTGHLYVGLYRERWPDDIIRIPKDAPASAAQLECERCGVWFNDDGTLIAAWRWSDSGQHRFTVSSTAAAASRAFGEWLFPPRVSTHWFRFVPNTTKLHAQFTVADSNVTRIYDYNTEAMTEGSCEGVGASVLAVSQNLIACQRRESCGYSVTLGNTTFARSSVFLRSDDVFVLGRNVFMECGFPAWTEVGSVSLAPRSLSDGSAARFSATSWISKHQLLYFNRTTLFLLDTSTEPWTTSPVVSDVWNYVYDPVHHRLFILLQHVSPERDGLYVKSL